MTPLERFRYNTLETLLDVSDLDIDTIIEELVKGQSDDVIENERKAYRDIYEKHLESNHMDKLLNEARVTLDETIEDEPLTIRGLLKECGVKLADDNNKTDIE